MIAQTQRFKVPFRTLAVRDDQIRRRLTDALLRVLDHGRMILGPEVQHLEETLARACGVSHCVGTCSGTSALYLALRALGIGRGDEVITTSLSWVATAAAIKTTGATPVFVDIGDDLNIDPATIAEARSRRTRAIVPVHFCGRMSDMTTIAGIAQNLNVAIVEDAAQAFGAEFNGIKAGAHGDLAAFSINPMKTLRSLGEAGAVMFQDQRFHARLESLRYAGLQEREICFEPDLNHRLSALQAAFIMVFLESCENDIQRRRALAQMYSERLHDFVRCPPTDDLRRSVFFDYQIVTDRRDALRQYLEESGVEVKIRYGTPMPEHPAFLDGPRAHFPNAKKLTQEILALPIDPAMTANDIGFVCDAIDRFFRK